jgi:hypothetical protein
MSKLKVFLLLVAVFALAYYLRVMFLPKSILTFGYDQARDATVSQQILKGDLKILGPSASTPGLYHGVFYYYFLAPVYLIGHGSPETAAYWVALFNSLVVFVVFTLTYLMTKKTLPAIIAALLFAISFEATQYATWLSNPTIAIWTVPLFYLGLWLWQDPAIKNKKINGLAPIICAIGLGLSIQAEIFLAYQIAPLVIVLWISRKNITKKQIALFLLTLILTLTSMLAAEVKFGFRSLAGLSQLAVSQEANLAYAKSLGDYLTLYLNQAGRIFAFNSYPGNIGYGGAFILILAAAGIWQLIKTKSITPQGFLAIWLLSHLSVVTVGGTSTPFLMVGIGPAVSIVIAIFLFGLWQKGQRTVSALLLAVLIFGNLSMVLRENPRGSTLFAIQKDMLLSKQLSLIDYTYAEAAGRPFSINSLTSPLWINIVWTYLYKWYGYPKYGYLPQWHGHDQVGQLDSLPKTEGGTNLYFLILEPMGGIPREYLTQTVDEENYYSTFIEEKSWGELVVQKREKKTISK